MAKKQFLLVTVVEREIFTELFSNFEKAKETMRKEFKECSTNKDTSEINFEKTCYFGDEYEWNETFAWINDGPNHSNYDWKIIEIPEK